MTDRTWRQRLFSLQGTITVTALFGLINAIARLMKGTALAMDDAKTNVFTQVWQWGYQPDNPPLFEWLIRLLHFVTGGGLISFLIVKYVALMIAAAFVHGTVRQYASARAAFAVATGMVLLYQIGWNYHEAFTHSALLIAGVAGVMWAGLRLVRQPGVRAAALFGLMAGIAMMTKYNAALFIVPFLVALVWARDTRGALLRPSAVLIPAVAAMVVLPHVLWFLNQTDAYNASLAQTMGREGAYLSRVGEGLGSLIVSALTFFLPFGLVALWLGRQGGTVFGTLERLLLRTAWISLGLLAVAVIAAGMGNVSERYLIPVLLPAYVAIASALLRRADEAFRPWFVACGGTALLVLVLRFAGAIFPGPPFCDRCLEFVPYDPLAIAIEAAVPDDAVLIVREENTGGNLVSRFPQMPVRVFTSLTLTNPIKNDEHPCFFIWSEDMVWGVPLEPAVAFAYDDPATIMVQADWSRSIGGKEKSTLWGITPLTGAAYTAFCTAER
ncbi:glycosyltransferase family 39 protein [Parvularcula sp. LCG005]|uniref:glycosyltransferase family 39 protein n=1 Tax=Parvularcula sp. LCG005 TaxID=3078805 RepID=UPI002943D0BC|nr:glycosyltransferase family 39 protein [Parvularcula sp. LCG005]WOI52856.1 glycosyltransferase family 39 protein [Parvularcula sp. LCG005]